MTAARSLTSLLACLALVASPAAAHAQGAGDDQYQDPFADTPSQQGGHGGSGGSGGSSQSGSGSGGRGGSGRSGSGLSKTPSVPLPASSAPAASAAPAAASAPTGTAATASPAAQAQLPRTGADPRLLALAGLAFVLVGLGLRLRTADELI